MTKAMWLRRTLSFALAAMMVFSVSAIAVCAQETTGVTIGAEGNAVELQPGAYTVPVALRNAGTIANDSMAAGCLAKQSKIVVDADGTVTAYLTMATLQMGADPFLLYGNATKLSCYTEHNTKSDMFEATVESTRKAKATPNFGPLVEVEVPEVFSFKMPFINQDGIYIQMFVDAMGMSPDAYVLFDYKKAKEIVDTTALQTLITECEKIKQNAYTEESFQALTTAIAEAKKLVAASDKTGAQVKDMVQKLSTAKAALDLKAADYTAVDKAIASIPADKAAYTEESVKKLEEAVAAVDRNLKVDRQADVDAMAQAIERAVAGLQKKAAEDTAAADKDPVPQTGDNSPMMVWTVLAAACVSTAAIMLAKKRKASAK